MLGKGKFTCTSLIATICNLEAGKTVEIGALLSMQVKLREWDNSFRSRKNNITFTKSWGIVFPILEWLESNFIDLFLTWFTWSLTYLLEKYLYGNIVECLSYTDFHHSGSLDDLLPGQP